MSQPLARINLIKQLPHFIVANKPPLCFSQPPDTSNPGLEKLYRDGSAAGDTIISQLEHSYPQLFDKKSELLRDPFCPPKIVQRLDYPVSGAMVLATSKLAAAQLSKSLKRGGNYGWPVEKYYAALVLGSPNTRIESYVKWGKPISVSRSDFTKPRICENMEDFGTMSTEGPKWDMDVRGIERPEEKLEILTGLINKNVDGKPALTQFWIPPQPKLAVQPYPLESKETLDNPATLPPYTLVIFAPITGRKHQIRIHASEVLRTPILGDEEYIEDRVQMLNYMKSGEYDRDMDKHGRSLLRTKHASKRGVERDPETGIILTGKSKLSPETVDYLLKYPVNGIALHSCMLRIKHGLKQTEARAPFFKNTEAWGSFIAEDDLLPEYIYDKISVSKSNLAHGIAY